MTPERSPQPQNGTQFEIVDIDSMGSIADDPGDPDARMPYLEFFLERLLADGSIKMLTKEDS